MCCYQFNIYRCKTEIKSKPFSNPLQKTDLLRDRRVEDEEEEEEEDEEEEDDDDLYPTKR